MFLSEAPPPEILQQQQKRVKTKTITKNQRQQHKTVKYTEAK